VFSQVWATDSPACQGKVQTWIYGRAQQLVLLADPLPGFGVEAGQSDMVVISPQNPMMNPIGGHGAVAHLQQRRP
jgi:hypothetical protein